MRTEQMQKSQTDIMKRGQVPLLPLILTEWIACVHAASMLGELVKHKMYLSRWEKAFISVQTQPHFYSRFKKFEGSWNDFPGNLRFGYIFETQHKLLMALHFCLLYWCLYFPLETESHFKSSPVLIDICIPRVEAWVNLLAVPDHFHHKVFLFVVPHW